MDSCPVPVSGPCSYVGPLLLWQHSFNKCDITGLLGQKTVDKLGSHRSWLADVKPNLSVFSYIPIVSTLEAFSDLCRGRGTVFQRHSSWSDAAWGDVKFRKWKKWAIRVDLNKSHLPLEDFCRISGPQVLIADRKSCVFLCVVIITTVR